MRDAPKDRAALARSAPLRTEQFRASNQAAYTKSFQSNSCTDTRVVTEPAPPRFAGNPATVDADVHLLVSQDRIFMRAEAVRKCCTELCADSDVEAPKQGC